MLSVFGQVEIFQGVAPDGIAQLEQRGRVRNFGTDEELMRQGQPSDCLHVIMHGRVRVERWHVALQDPVILAELGPGEVVGEMGVLDGGPRSATVRAIEPTETIELSAEALHELLQAFPESTLTLASVLTRRLRSANELIEDAVRRIRSGEPTDNPAAPSATPKADSQV